MFSDNLNYILYIFLTMEKLRLKSKTQNVKYFHFNRDGITDLRNVLFK